MGYTGDIEKETDNMIKVDLPFLSLSDKESVIIRLLSPPEKYIGGEFFVARCEVLINDLCDSLVLGNEYLLEINSKIYKGMSAEFKKNNIVMDKDLKCMVGRVWIIRGVERRLPIVHKTYRITLRKDLEVKKTYEKNIIYGKDGLT